MAAAVQRLLSQSLLHLLFLKVFLCTTSPAPLACNEDHRHTSESCHRSGGPSLLQVAHKRQLPSEIESLEGSSSSESEGEEDDSVVDEALRNLDAKSVVGMMGELKDTVSASDFFGQTEGLAGRVSPINANASQNLISISVGDSGENASNASNASSGSPEPACNPSCRYSCSSPVCEEECEPHCKPGKCETRCSTMDLAGCMLGCEQPECATVCPKHHCRKSSCPKCSTKCSEPLCKLRCPQKQNCTSICESPSCTWKCKKPQRCPKPECKLECEAQSQECQTSVKENLPALEKGEIKVASFFPPASLLQMSPGQLTQAGRQIEELRLGAVVESMDAETSQISHFVIELPVAY